MSKDQLRDELQSALGASYTLERELGGGGMSRVFVARDEGLGRTVVVKVLAPELAQGLSAERFSREIRLAAALQQANVVPLLAAGVTADGLPYYTMPFVEGESLRAHLIAHGALPLSTALSILRDVARALGYAHQHGIVHRDIKPDNVLLSHGAAVVTDFGIAKAVGAARSRGASDEDGQSTTGGALTALGTSLGTPAYMAPEQAAGDPSADHRIDLYAFGCLAYELLAGVPPFHGLSPQKMLAAQMSERARPIEQLRPEVPSAVAELIARCLEKDPNARPASAAEVLRVLDGVSVSASAAAASMPSLLAGGPAMFRRALVLYVIAFLAVAVLAKLAITWIGLPDWVFPGALVVMGLGLPLLLFTGYTQRVMRHAVTATPTFTPGGSPAPQRTMAALAIKASPHLSWRRFGRGGALALAAFVVLVAVIMGLRAAGIGPVGTLFASGAMKADDALVVADFTSPGDSTLGRTIAQGVKADLTQSRAVRVLDDAAVASAMRRMQQPDASLTLAIAREVAERAGAKMVVDGSISPLGSGFLVSLRLVTADSGHEVVSYRASVNAPGDLIPAVGTLTRKLRSKIGESLRELQASPRLEEVTTTSIEALRKYTEALHALLHDSDRSRFVRLLQEAIAADSSFAVAYSALAIELDNRGGAKAEVERLLTKAYALRERLPEREQRGIEAYYFLSGPPGVRDSAKARVAALAAASGHPEHSGSDLNPRRLNNVGSNLWSADFPVQADSIFRMATAADTGNTYTISNEITLLLSHGHAARAESLITVYRRRFPTNHVDNELYAVSALVLRGADDSALTLLRGAIAQTRDLWERERLAGMADTISSRTGRIRERDAASALVAAARQARGVASVALDAVLERANYVALVVGNRAEARRLLDSAAVDARMQTIDEADRPYAAAASAYAAAGDAATARRYLAGVERQIPEKDLERAYVLRTTRADVALAEHRWDDAIREARLAHVGYCNDCGQIRLALAYDARAGAGDRDSAIAAFERTRVNLLPRPTEAPVLRRLGELYEAKGDVAKAIERYDQFITLWQRADRELQPQVAEVKQRLARLRTRSG